MYVYLAIILHHVMFKSVEKTLVSPNVYRFVFALPRPTDVLGLPTGQHIALRATVQGQSVSRSYTPISNNTDLGRNELLIKVYPQGLMTKHLEAMSVCEEMEIRGPKGAMQYSRSYAKQIGMIAGGTGITPMYQLIRAICEDEKDNTKVSLLYANNTKEDILLREELDAFAAKDPAKFKVQYVLAKALDEWKGLKGFISQEMIKEHLAQPLTSTKCYCAGHRQ
jgi:cytochrome-b5 reductase